MKIIIIPVKAGSQCYLIDEIADKINHKKIYKFKISVFLKIRKIRPLKNMI